MESALSSSDPGNVKDSKQKHFITTLCILCQFNDNKALFET